MDYKNIARTSVDSVNEETQRGNRVGFVAAASDINQLISIRGDHIGRTFLTDQVEEIQQEGLCTFKHSRFPNTSQYLLPVHFLAHLRVLLLIPRKVCLISDCFRDGSPDELVPDIGALVELKGGIMTPSKTFNREEGQQALD